jgi:hypothetical protein
MILVTCTKQNVATITLEKSVTSLSAEPLAYIDEVHIKNISICHNHLWMQL